MRHTSEKRIDIGFQIFVDDFLWTVADESFISMQSSVHINPVAADIRDEVVV